MLQQSHKVESAVRIAKDNFELLLEKEKIAREESKKLEEMRAKREADKQYIQQKHESQQQHQV